MKSQKSNNDDIKYRRLVAGEVVLRGDQISSKHNLLPFGLVEVTQNGEIHIGYCIIGDEACYCYRADSTPIMDSTDAHGSDMEKIKRENARLRSALEDISNMEHNANLSNMEICTRISNFAKQALKGGE